LEWVGALALTDVSSLLAEVKCRAEKWTIASSYSVTVRRVGDVMEWRRAWKSGRMGERRRVPVKGLSSGGGMKQSKHGAVMVLAVVRRPSSTSVTTHCSRETASAVRRRI